MSTGPSYQNNTRSRSPALIQQSTVVSCQSMGSSIKQKRSVRFADVWIVYIKAGAGLQSHRVRVRVTVVSLKSATRGARLMRLTSSSSARGPSSPTRGRGNDSSYAECAIHYRTTGASLLECYAEAQEQTSWPSLSANKERGGALGDPTDTANRRSTLLPDFHFSFAARRATLGRLRSARSNSPANSALNSASRL